MIKLRAMQPEDFTPSPEGTRLALIEAGFCLFGQHSFAATSTRQLASLAKANIGSIAYHFGGKAGLRQACAEEVARRMQAIPAAMPPQMLPSAEDAIAQLQTFLRSLVRFLFVGPQAETMLPFMLRELSEQGPAVEVLYSRMVGPMHQRLCLLWGAATQQDPETDAVRLVVFSLIGQVLYFRVGAPIVTRRLGWSAIGPAETAQITQTLLATLDALLAASERP
jgi:TetR/AcrR family transcriptional regulator, regulator of cefoperazone and chloramphenicol sensitivity